MPWFKVDDGLHSHPKPRRAGLAAMGLWAVAGSWSAQHAQEGFVPDWFVSGWPQGRKYAAALIAAGLWHHADKEGEQGYQFHDWQHFQPSKEEIERDRENSRERQRRFRERRREARLKVVKEAHE